MAWINQTEERMPIPEGFSRGEKVDKSPVEITDSSKAQRVQSAKSLKELEADYAFFTPALLYLRVSTEGHDPLRSFLNEYGKPFFLCTLRFDSPVFSGLENAQGNPFWNYHLLVIEREHWLPFAQWAATLSFFDPKTQVLTTVRPQRIEIADPLLLSSVVVAPVPTPLVSVGTFALDTNRGTFWIEDAGNPLLDLPRPMFTSTAEGDTQAFAQAVAAGDPHPHRQAEAARTAGTDLSPSEAWLLDRWGTREPVTVPAGRMPIESLPQNEREEIKKMIDLYVNTSTEEN